MSVPVGVARTRNIGSGSAGPFPFNFVLYDPAHVTVVKTSIAGVDAVLLLTTDYSVTIAPDFSSASITLTTPLVGTGVDNGTSEILTITRDPPVQQLTEWPRNDPFPSKTHERAADLAVMMIGRLNEKLGRSLLLPESANFSGLQLPLPEALAFLRWNATEDGLENQFILPTGSLTVSPFMTTVLDDVSAAAARATLAAVGTADVINAAHGGTGLTTAAAAAALYAGLGAGFGTQVDIASAATVDLGTAPSHNVQITGVTTITSFGSSASPATPLYLVKFGGILTVTHSATLVLPGLANYVTTAGDCMLVELVATGDWRVRAILPRLPAPSIGCANGLTIKNNAGAPTTQIDVVTTGRSVLESAAGATISVAALSVTINAATVGVNGLDAGALAANTEYHIYIISNGVTTAALLSLSATAPTMPAGYVYKYRVGATKTLGASTFVRFIQVGNQFQFVVVAGSTTPNMPILASGAAGNPATPTWVSLPVNNAVTAIAATTAKRVRGVVASAAGSNNVQVAPNSAYGAAGSTTNPPFTLLSTTASNGGSQQFDMPLESTSIFWASVAAGSSIAISGWTDAVNAS